MCIERCTHGSAGGVGKRASAPRPAPTQLEEEYEKRPPYGVVINDGSRVVVKHTEALRSEILSMAEKVRERRRGLGQEIEARHPLAKSRAHGHRGSCNLAARHWQGEQLLRSLGRNPPL